MQAVILAGGYGTRLSEKTDNIPKPMVEIGGQPILWHIMKHYSVFGVRDFILCLGYKSDVIQNYFRSIKSEALSDHQVLISMADGCNWRVTLAETGLDTGTAGRLRKIRPFLTDDHFHMTYGDGLSDVNLSVLAKLHQTEKALATVTAITPPSRYGFLELNGSTVSNFQEKPVTPDHVRINGGFFMLAKGSLDYIADDTEMWENAPMQKLVEEKKLSAHRHDGFWHCIDTLRDYRRASQLWNEGKAPWKTWP